MASILIPKNIMLYSQSKGLKRGEGITLLIKCIEQDKYFKITNVLHTVILFILVCILSLIIVL